MNSSRDQRSLLQNLNVASAAALALTGLNYSEYHTLIKGLRRILVRVINRFRFVFFVSFRPLLCCLEPVGGATSEYVCPLSRNAECKHTCMNCDQRILYHHSFSAVFPEWFSYFTFFFVFDLAVVRSDRESKPGRRQSATDRLGCGIADGRK